MTTAIHRLNELGQSIWYDNIRRGIIDSGELATLIEQGISGVTSNPTIFEKAINGSSDYDAQFAQLVAANKSIEEIYDALVLDDIARGADLLRPVYDRTGGADGYISIEVPPTLAQDTQKTIEEARRLFNTLGRPNIMVKVPATPEGIPAIRQLLSDGININVTLIFSLDAYEKVMDAYLAGLEDRLSQGHPISHVASVASFFVSRVDTLVDRLIKEKGLPQSLAGKAAIANAKLAYELFLKYFGSLRFEALKSHGARVQRPLWASTSTKNPAYPDLLYVDNLIGPDTVNTLPPQTVSAVLDHVKVDRTVDKDVDSARQAIRELESHGILMKDVTSQLLREGVESFSASFVTLFEGLTRKMSDIAGDVQPFNWNQDILHKTADETISQLTSNHAVRRIWEHDASLWKSEPEHQAIIKNALGWLTVPEAVANDIGNLKALTQELINQGYTDVVVLGMGGSSLISDVLRHVFPASAPYLRLQILDSTNPDAVLELKQRLPLATTVFIVASKSGTTTEPQEYFRYFWNSMNEITAKPGEHFIAITDPGTALVSEAEQHHFRKVFLNPADIGGRYSALSWFGMVPAALSGVDVEALLANTRSMQQMCRIDDVSKNPGALLGALMGAFGNRGRDKLTLLMPASLAPFSDWIEQLIAESTGKDGKGLLPIAHEPVLPIGDYSDDRLFVAYQYSAEPDSELTERIKALRHQGHPVIILPMTNPISLGGELFRWEFAVAVAGSVLGINAFDQPNVQESKDNTKGVLKQFEASKALPEIVELGHMDHIHWSAAHFITSGSSVSDVLKSLLNTRQHADYVAIMAYVNPTGEMWQHLQNIRAVIGSNWRIPTTLGFGPRFLHSTGQLHKGGSNHGLFIQLVAATGASVPIPGEPFDFLTLIQAQAIGDYEALKAHGRRVVRILFDGQPVQALSQLSEFLQTISIK
ncbi:MAG: bifunctional transaldolase/phosoglucose isomerase [Firmicutes bacterium]|nr:bifunctional transaldolase/phosoglucose isomerase [Bacillota bacterium]MCL5015206.1 bifunctional transaldolase/phosoglucose isomerase [Bacillota bacterium]